MNKTNKGFTLVELLVVIGILGILMGALFPAITAVMLQANLTAMKSNGKNLVMGILAASKEGSSIWPHEKEADGLDTSDSTHINGTSYGTSTEYFKKLYDVENKDSSNWMPYIQDDAEFKFLSGQGVPKSNGSSLQAANVGWAIISGMSDGMDGSLPVLFSRNMDVEGADLPKNGEYKSASKTQAIKLGTKYQTPFSTKACVIVRKNGSANDYNARDAKPNQIYNKATVIIPEGQELKYLMP